jgi:hypothetical protein
MFSELQKVISIQAFTQTSALPEPNLDAAQLSCERGDVEA